MPPRTCARLLATHGPEHARRRREDPKYRFQWPRGGGRKLYEVAHAALAEMTTHRCSYCDGTARLKAVKEIQRRQSDDELADVAYRFLIPLVMA